MIRRTARSKSNERSPPLPGVLDEIASLMDPYRVAWVQLSPGERLERSWRLRRLIPNPKAVHDAKTLPEL